MKIKNNKRILIVDDEPYNILSLQILIKMSGYPNLISLVDTCNNG